MPDPVSKLAKILRTQPPVMAELEKKMNALTGQEGVFEDIVRQHEITVDQTLAGLGVTRKDGPQAIRAALSERLAHFDAHLAEMIGRPTLSDTNSCSTLCATVKKVFTPAPGLFLKESLIKGFLNKYPPGSLLEHFGYKSVDELLDKEGIVPVMAALRFTQSTEWMHQFFGIAYSDLGLDDFEERDVQIIVLPSKWLEISEKFREHKYHNVSHLKELGIIFILPTKLDTPGDTLELFVLLLHYMHEVPFYADIFRRQLVANNGDFSEKFKSLLRGDVPSAPLPDHGKLVWRIVQRYLAKDNPDDFRLFEPHVNPEADHWWHAEEDLGRLSRILGKDHGTLDLGWWTGLDYVGEYFTDPKTGVSEMVSFDLVDLIITLARNEETMPFLYHHQEALWNKIFTEYMGRERMEELMQTDIFKGFIEL